MPASPCSRLIFPERSVTGMGVKVKAGEILDKLPCWMLDLYGEFRLSPSYRQGKVAPIH